MSNKKKSIIPPKLQVPVTVVLGLMFILMLGVQLKRAQTSKRKPPTDAATAVTTETSPEQRDVADAKQRLDVLVRRISSVARPEEHEVAAPSRPRWDPFVRPESVDTKIRRAKGDTLNAQPESEQGARVRNRDLYGGQSREQLIERLTIQGTVLDGNARLAIIDGRMFAQGDHLGPFRIVRIGECSALLRDNNGDELIKMKGDEEL